jgi:hypothetical protein
MYLRMALDADQNLQFSFRNAAGTYESVLYTLGDGMTIHKIVAQQIDAEKVIAKNLPQMRFFMPIKLPGDYNVAPRLNAEMTSSIGAAPPTITLTFGKSPSPAWKMVYSQYVELGYHIKIKFEDEEYVEYTWYIEKPVTPTDIFTVTDGLAASTPTLKLVMKDSGVVIAAVDDASWRITCYGTTPVY